MGARMRDRKFPGVLSMTSGSYSFIIVYELALSLVICPFPAIFMGSAFNNYTTIFSGVSGYVRGVV